MKVVDVSIPEEVTGTRVTEEVSHAIIDSFHHLLYNTHTWQRTLWRGVPVQKLPSDMFLYQELIYLTRPDFIIETGTAHGGSALFFADMLELVGHGMVLTIDINFEPDRPTHPRIAYVSEDSIEMFDEIKNTVQGRKALVSLDSDHNKEHVLKEMELYSTLATEYLVVEDTNIGHPIDIEQVKEGPMEAVTEFLKTHDEFEIEPMAHKFLVTFNPNGWLRRVR